jgi:uncharacterized caspase-like protein
MQTEKTLQNLLLAGVLVLISSIAMISESAAKRVALIIGNSAYEYSPPLSNPVNDANALARSLSNLDFNVTKAIDQDLDSLLETLERFYETAKGADTALFFYAGHGLQFDGTNYLVPTDATLRSKTRVKRETIALQDIITAIEQRSKITLVMLDACRDNPMSDDLHRRSGGGTRSATVKRGLAPMSVRNPNMLLVYAAAPGKTAADGDGSNSPFTTALLKNIETPGIEVELLMKRVTRDVVQSTKGEQVPERLSRLTAEFVFKAAAAPSPSFATQVPSFSTSVSKSDPCKSDNPPLSCLWSNK